MPKLALVLALALSGCILPAAKLPSGSSQALPLTRVERSAATQARFGSAEGITQVYPRLARFEDWTSAGGSESIRSRDQRDHHEQRRGDGPYSLGPQLYHRRGWHCQPRAPLRGLFRQRRSGDSVHDDPGAGDG